MGTTGNATPAEIAALPAVIRREIKRLSSLLHEPGAAPGDRARQDDLRRRIHFLRTLTVHGIAI